METENSKVKFKTQNSKLKIQNWTQNWKKTGRNAHQKSINGWNTHRNWNWNLPLCKIETETENSFLLKLGEIPTEKTGWNAYWNLATCARPLMAQLESRRREQTNLKLSAMSWALEIGSDGNGPLASALHMVLVLRLYVRGNLSGTCRLPWT